MQILQGSILKKDIFLWFFITMPQLQEFQDWKKLNDPTLKNNDIYTQNLQRSFSFKNWGQTSGIILEHFCKIIG